MPAQHGGSPSVEDDAAGGAGVTCHEDVARVVAVTHRDERTGDDFAEEHGDGAEESGDTESASELQWAL